MAAPAVALLAAGCAGGEGAAATTERRERRPEAVEIAVAALGDTRRARTVTGTVEPIRTVGVVSQLSGVLRDVAVEEGDVVAQGTVLARVDVPEVRSQLVGAEAALRLAETAGRRSAQLFRDGVLTAPENERDQSALAAARATRDQLRARLGFATVRAPIDGVVLERTVRTGDLASPQQRLFTLGDVSTLVVRVAVTDRDVAALRETQPVEVSLDAQPGRPVDGVIRRIFPAADSVTRLVPVEVALRGDGARRARPGFLARVTFALAAGADALLVPGPAVLQNARGAVVYVVRDGRAVARQVERGDTFDGRVEIRSGLSAGDTVITAGNTLVRDGAAVRITAPPVTAAGDDAAPATPAGGSR